MDKKDKDIKITESEIFTPIELDFTINVAEIMAARDAVSAHTEEPPEPEAAEHLDDVQMSETAANLGDIRIPAVPEFLVQELFEQEEIFITGDANETEKNAAPDFKDVSVKDAAFNSKDELTESSAPDFKDEPATATAINFENEPATDAVPPIGEVVGPGYIGAVGPKFVSGAKATGQKLPKSKKKRKKKGKNYEQLSKPKKVLYDLMLILVYFIAVIGSVVAALGIVRVADVTTYDIELEKIKANIQVNEVDVASSLQGYTAGQVVSEEAIPSYTLEEIYALDLRQPSGATEADLRQITRSGLVGLEDTFLEAEKTYGVNAVFLISIASVESGYGTQMYRPNNMFGYGGKSYPSKEACIMDVAQGLSSRYLTPGSSLYGGSPTVRGVNKRYAANTQWYAKVGKYMHSYYSVISPYHNQMLEKIQ